MSSIDLHSHVIPPTIVAAIEHEPERFGMRFELKDNKRYFNAPGRKIELMPGFCDVDAKIEWMDRKSLTISAISVAPPIYFYWLSADAGLAAAKLSNDGIAQMVAKRPERLRGMATLPMQDPDAAVAELERAVREHKFRAVELGTSIEGRPLADPKFRKVLKTIEQLGCFVHGFNARPEAKTKTRSSPRDLLRRFYFDSLLHDPVAVRHLINRVGADRVVIGTDHPFDMAPDNPVPEIDAIPQLSASEREYVCELTALELLGED